MATKTISVYFPESTSRSQSKIVNVQDLTAPVTTTVDNGSVTNSVSGKDVTVNVSNGIATRSVKEYKYDASGYYTDTDPNNFQYSYIYDDGTYTGAIPKSGSYYTIGYTDDLTRHIVQPTTSATLVWVYEWTGSSWKYKSSRVDPASIHYTDGDGYSGDLPYVVSSYDGNYPVAPPVSAGTGQPVGYTTTRSASGYATYEGDTIKPGGPIYRQDYYGTASRDVNYYAYTVSLTYTIRRPDDFSWYTSKVKDGDFSLLAVEWNALCARINDFREYKGVNRATIMQAVTSDTVLASMFNEARNAIAIMNASVPNLKSRDNIIYADDLNRLRDSLNAMA